MNRNHFARHTAVVLALTLGGCSLGPYVDPGEPRPGLVRDDRGNPVKDASGNIRDTSVSVGQAREYARLLQDAYREKIRSSSSKQLITNTSLIAIAASAIGLAATGGATEAIAALGISGAALGAAGTQLVIATQRQIYAQGALALECVIGAASAAPDASATNAAAKAALNDLNATLAALGAEIAIARAQEGTCQDSSRRAELVAQLDEYSATAAASSEYAAQVARTLDALDPRGQILLSAVENVRWRVDQELAKSEPDLLAFDAALKAQLESASAAYRSSGGQVGAQPQAPAVEVAHAKKTSWDAEAPAPEACEELARAVNTVNSRLSPLKAKVEAARVALAGAGPVAGYDAALFSNCAVANPVGRGALRVEPPETSIAGGSAAVLQTTVRGGKLPYSSDTTTLPAGVTVEPGAAVPDGQVYSVKLTADASSKAGAPIVVLFRDSTGVATTFVVKVTKESGTPAGNAPPAAAVAPDPRVERIQRELLPPSQVDGHWGPVTEGAVREFVKQNYASLPAAERTEPPPNFDTLPKAQLLTIAEKLLGLA